MISPNLSYLMLMISLAHGTLNVERCRRYELLPFIPYQNTFLSIHITLCSTLAIIDLYMFTFVLKERITESLKKFSQFYGSCFARYNTLLHTVSFFCELSLFVEAQTS